MSREHRPCRKITFAGEIIHNFQLNASEQRVAQTYRISYAALAFFLALGFEREGLGLVEGEWVDKIVGLEGVRAEMVFVRTPDGSGTLELVKFHAPADTEGAHPWRAHRLGFRHICFQVKDIATLIDGLRDRGYDTVGEVRDYEDIYRLCYVRGPEGLIVELAERIASEGAS